MTNYRGDALGIFADRVLPLLGQLPADKRFLVFDVKALWLRMAALLDSPEPRRDLHLMERLGDAAIERLILIDKSLCRDGQPSLFTIPDVSAETRRRETVRPGQRFRIFTRDGWACRYCGRGVPEVVLEVDHKVPWVKGGRSSDDNLVTACRDCNRGKGIAEL